MTTKQRILTLVNNLPEDIDIAQVIDRLYLLQKVEEGVRQADAGGVVDHDEFMRELLAEDEEN